MNTRLLIALVICCLAWSLTGCGGGGDDPNQGEDVAHPTEKIPTPICKDGVRTEACV